MAAFVAFLLPQNKTVSPIFCKKIATPVWFHQPTNGDPPPVNGFLVCVQHRLTHASDSVSPIILNRSPPPSHNTQQPPNPRSSLYPSHHFAIESIPWSPNIW